jgi:cell division cycle 2-like
MGSKVIITYIVRCNPVNKYQRQTLESIPSKMSTDSSTSSRKRSKWDAEEEEQALHAQLVKRRAKAKAADDSNMSNRPKNPTRSSHSLYVPPRTHHPHIVPSRSVYCYERLNQIEEGSYGVVFRARDKETGEIVALKKLKLDEEKNGFPITALREVNALMSCRHENVVGIREVVVGDTLTQCVSIHLLQVTI